MAGQSSDVPCMEHAPEVNGKGTRNFYYCASCPHICDPIP